MRRRPLDRFIAAVFAGILAAAVAPARGQETAETAIDPADEARIEEILELRRQLGELLGALPPELAAEVERRWAEEAGSEARASTERPPGGVTPEAAASAVAEVEPDSPWEAQQAETPPDEPLATPPTGAAVADRPAEPAPSNGERARDSDDTPLEEREELSPRAIGEEAASGPVTTAPATPRTLDTTEQAASRTPVTDRGPSAPAPETPGTSDALEPAASPTPVVDQAPAAPTRPQPPPSPRCDTLDVLDSNGDGQISGADRYWRHLRLWRDDGDGRLSSSEIERPFDLGIRRIAVRLRSYTAKKDASFDIWLEELVRFDLPKGGRVAYLAIDAGALARGGEARLTNAAGAPLSGVVPIRRGVYWQAGDGQPRALRCG